MTKFARWVDAMGGQAATARKLGTTRATINKWMVHGNMPRVAMIEKIQRLSNGRLTVADIFTHSFAIQYKQQKATK